MDKKKGFSLIELMIVISVIGILAAIAIPSYVNYEKKAKVVTLITQAEFLEKQVEETSAITGSLPDKPSVYVGSSLITSYQIYRCPRNPMVVWIHVNPGPEIVNYNASLILQGTLDTNGTITWVCSTHPGAPIPSEYLPGTCLNTISVSGIRSTGCNG